MKDAPRISGESHDGPVSDATLRGFFGYRMKRCFNVIQADLARTLRPFDLRMLTYTALVLVTDNPGLRQAQLAEAMDIERPNLVAITEELARRGLILRNRVPTDRRAYALEATPAGVKLCAEATEAVRAHEAALLAGLDDEMRGLTLEAMKRIERIRPRG
ncbi:MarR family winged helix-turn-helix transcriptional regulator [Tropicimonas sp. IMCC6043]|uniref:MarR family winged helix-turn-helix transcriptional regulator n=1 Tax=Tropicimonas sp. IMCC6043 TaxID=2510645 RepID=UPI00101D2870|nr:MarR family transcriptional regulator [Tropicimonas sp. IMCC6043]RYH12204.1 MarR family transcriptional regulator [Tropicimonas sp. IMCC6043]